jgi:hypothetical protein
MTATSVLGARAGVIAAKVIAARYDRLRWLDDVTVKWLPPNTVQRRATAVGDRSTMHRAVTADGAAAWVREVRGGDAFASAAAHADAARLVAHHGIVIPAVCAVSNQCVWLDRWAWSPTSTPAASTVDWFVESAVQVALQHGVVVALGEPHLRGDGGIVVEDAGVAAVLEPAERILVARICRRLVDLDAVGVADAVAELCGERVPGLSLAAQRATLSLAVDWTTAGFGLSLHHVAAFATPAGRRAMPLRLLADELLHRLDLAHAHPHGLAAFANREAVHRVLATGTNR